ncbi:MAG: hypothetical protein IKQ16_07885 [Lentisphaeria bacterium]|nr:hypothetical protein [Lentisphaeria bacterium]
MENAELILAAAKEATHIVDDIINACVECRKIDAQIEAMRAQAEVDNHRLDVQEKALKLQHKENMKIIDEYSKRLQKYLDDHHKEIEDAHKTQGTRRRQLDEINAVILDTNTPEDTRATLIRYYALVSQQMEDTTMALLHDSIQLIQKTDMICLPDHKPSSQKQISTSEED